MMSLPFNDIFRNKKIFITGHTGFKGSWLTLWLSKLGADIHGYALPPPTNPSLFELLNLENDIQHTIADVRDREHLTKSIANVKPDIIFHLAAQSVVSESYVTPADTVETNVLGTINVMEATRNAGIATAIVMVTSDKCYHNSEWLYGYRENDPMGGYDPYSASKGAAEILISSWRNSFFNPEQINEHGVRIATARAGNVIGGGDWTKDQLIPDCIRSLSDQKIIQIRNPHATRPWQHVLEPLGGYLQLGARLLKNDEDVIQYCEAFNFGPLVSSNRSVKELVDGVIECWGTGSWKFSRPEKAFHESNLLGLSIDKTYNKLKWLPKWDFKKTIGNTVEWYKMAAMEPSNILEFSLNQIRKYEYDGNPSSEQRVPETISLNT
jgi:CDP-glucose 4,6-dehydratase